MARRFPGTGRPPGDDGAASGDWLTYEQYQVRLLSLLDALEAEGLVLRDTVAFAETYDMRNLVRVVVRGNVFCALGVVLHLRERLAVRRGRRNHTEVVVEHFQYHAWQVRSGVARRRHLLRIDDSHGRGPHRHIFDLDGSETAIEAIEPDRIPDLGDTIRGAIVLGAR